ncbi:MAG: phosphatase PAP2 family protein [Gammaproteobacteria bacterium]|nr:phosphatase PAP2 family protein [Gammaproteobacteria bacterium]
MRRAARYWLMAAMVLYSQFLPADDWIDDTTGYFLSPTEWNSNQWLLFTGVAGLAAIAQHNDEAVRYRFDTRQSDRGDRAAHLGNSWGEVIGLSGASILGVYSVGWITGNKDLVQTGNNAVESLILACTTTSLLKRVFDRKRPNQTESADDFFQGGRSFPSGHVTAAFVLSTTFAEAGGNPSWYRRLFFYSLAATTAYARMYDQKHWLSDTIIGAAIGTSTAIYVNNRNPLSTDGRPGLSVTPTGIQYSLSWR